MQFEDGKKGHIYLLDEAMGMEKVGQISVNLAGKIVEAAEAPYRVAAELVSSMTDERISTGGTWNLVQKLVGERVRVT